MFTQEEVQAIIDKMSGPVLTVYIDTNNATDTNQATIAGWRTWFKNELKRIAANTENDPAWQSISEQAEAYFTDYSPNGKGLALFIGADNTREIEVPMPIENYVSYGKPMVAPLLWLLDEYEPYLIVLVDNEHASILHTTLGRVRGEDKLKVDTDEYDFGERTEYQLGAMAQGDFRDLFEKTVNEHKMRYFREVVDHLEKISREKNVTRILFGGIEEAAKQVIGLLPKHLADKVVGWQPIPMRSDPQTIIDRALPAALEYERQREAELVEEVISYAKMDGRGALGHNDVMLALAEQRVELLVIPYPIEDKQLAAELPHKVRESSGTIELVHGEAADRLNQEGGIGARLYYAIPSAGNRVPTQKESPKEARRNEN